MGRMKAVLFDMDGVLVDSEEFIAAAAVEMFNRRGVKVELKDFVPFVGMGENRYLGGVADKYGMTYDIDEIKAQTYDLYGEIIQGKLKSLPGVDDFIKKCRSLGFKLAVATSADYPKMKSSLDEIGFSFETFDALVNGLDVDRKKPHPDIYQEAARRLGVDPVDCLVVEDAISGVAAAKAAGAKALGLTSSFTARELAQADWVVDSLETYPEEIFTW